MEGYGGRAVGSGLISGKGNGIFDPTGPAKRAETLAIFQRFIESNKVGLEVGGSLGVM